MFAPENFSLAALIAHTDYEGLLPVTLAILTMRQVNSKLGTVCYSSRERAWPRVVLL
jgi:hypothetical protein